MNIYKFIAIQLWNLGYRKEAKISLIVNRCILKLHNKTSTIYWNKKYKIIKKTTRKLYNKMFNLGFTHEHIKCGMLYFLYELLLYCKFDILYESSIKNKCEKHSIELQDMLWKLYIMNSTKDIYPEKYIDKIFSKLL